MKILSVKEVREMTGFSQSFIYKHYKKLLGVKIAGKIIFNESKLEEALNDCKKTEGEETLAFRVPIRGETPLKRRVRVQKRSTGSGNLSPQDVEESLKRHNLVLPHHNATE